MTTDVVVQPHHEKLLCNTALHSEDVSSDMNLKQQLKKNIPTDIKYNIEYFHYYGCLVDIISESFVERR